MRYLLILLLTGCCTNPIVSTNTTIEVDKKVFEECKEQIIPESPLTYESILENVRDNSLIYKECKAKNSIAITLIKKLTNQKDK